MGKGAVGGKSPRRIANASNPNTGAAHSTDADAGPADSSRSNARPAHAAGAVPGPFTGETAFGAFPSKAAGAFAAKAALTAAKAAFAAATIAAEATSSVAAAVAAEASAAAPVPANRPSTAGTPEAARIGLAVKKRQSKQEQSAAVNAGSHGDRSLCCEFSMWFLDAGLLATATLLS
jgi:hypothetical protein